MDLVELIALADELGFDGCYSADETYHKDMWVLFGAAAGRTKRIRFGPEVTHVILRDPTMIAQQAATLDELTGGRAEIVYSIGNVGMLDQYQIEWRGTRPLARLREAHHVMRTFLDEGSIDFEGEFYRYHGPVHGGEARTGTLADQDRRHAWTRARFVSPARSQTAFTSPAHTRPRHSVTRRAMVREGATRADRELDDQFDFCASILGAISLDGDAAREAAGVAAAFYLSSMPPELVERHGIVFAEVEPVVEAFARGDVDRALALAPADAGDRFALAGTPSEWIDRIRQDFLPHGYNHIALGLADPFLVERWTGRPTDGLPSARGPAAADPRPRPPGSQVATRPVGPPCATVVS